MSAAASTSKRQRPSIASVAASSTAPADDSRPVTAHDVLSAAGAGITDNAAERDTAGDRSMRATLAAFGAIEGVSLSERQGWQLLALFKMVHAAAGARNGLFNAIDATSAAAYAALSGEAAAAAAGVTVQP